MHHSVAISSNGEKLGISPTAARQALGTRHGGPCPRSSHSDEESEVKSCAVQYNTTATSLMWLATEQLKSE